MAHHSTDISTKCGRKVLFKKSSKSVTGFSGVLMFKDALKKSTFVQNICDTVNYWFPRDSIFYAYRTRDLIMMRLTRLACGLPDFIDGVQFKEDAAVRHAFGRCPSAATDSRFYNRIGGVCTAVRDQRIHGNPEDLPKGDPNRIGSLFMTRLNTILLKEAISRAPRHNGFVIIDADSTVIPCYGKQDEVAYCGKQGVKGYYPLHVYINGYPAWIQNAPGATDGRHLLRIALEPILQEVIDSGVSPERILIRADAGFNANDLIKQIEDKGCKYILGFGQNKTVLSKVSEQLLQIPPAPGHPNLPSEIRTRISAHAPKELRLCSDKDDLPLFDHPFRICGHVRNYRARSWSMDRTIIYRIDHSAKYDNTDFRFIQTNLTAEECSRFFLFDGVRKCHTNVWDCPEDFESAQRAIDLYDGLYSDRGNCELWIREFKESWSGHRMNTLDFFANWFLMFIAFVGMSFLRGWLTAKLGIKGLKMKLTTFREKFLRVPALIKVSSKQVVVEFSDKDDEWWRDIDSLIV